MTRDENINRVYNSMQHVVILGAGASIAASQGFPEDCKFRLPSMNNLVEVIGLQDIIDTLPNKIKEQFNQHSNFELLFSEIHRIETCVSQVKEIENRVRSYFECMKLPDSPTIYDYLMLSLRGKDVIATFNWDPFLHQAYCRNSRFVDAPRILHLHGNVALGYNEEIDQWGPAGYTTKKELAYFEPTPLLFPILEKDYTSHPFIKRQWEILKKELSNKHTNFVTIFGYSAPDTDVEAMDLLSNAWGPNHERNMEQIEIIDIQEEEVLRPKWDRLICEGHYYWRNDFFSSSIARNPRRTCEVLHNNTQPLSMEEAFIDPIDVPSHFANLAEMWDWYKPLVEAEKRKT